METLLKAQAGLALDPAALALVPAVVGLVEIAKQAGLPSRFAPLASIALGVGLSALLGSSWQASIAQGIVVGLAASGLWSGGQALAARKPPAQ